QDVDFLAAKGTLTFPPGTPTQTIDITINGDISVEPDETFTVNLVNPTNATIGTNQATGLIINDDLTRISIDNITVTEGNSGTTKAAFTVTLSDPINQTVTVNYATSDGTATAASGDYVAAQGTLTFSPRNTTQSLILTVNGDTLVEPD